VGQRSGGETPPRDISATNRRLFEAYRGAEGLRGHTVQGLQSTLRGVRKLLGYLESQGLEAGSVGMKEALAYQGWLQEQGYCRTTVLFELYAATSFYAHLKRRGLIASNPFTEIKKPKREKHLPPHLLREAEIALLLDDLSHFERGMRLIDRAKAYRAHVVAEFLYATGIRASEAAGVRVGDVDLEAGLVRVREGKGRVSRSAILGGYAAGVLELYLTRMRPLMLTERNARSRQLLFGLKWNSFGESANSVYRTVCRRLGLPRTSCHLFRHAVGYHLLRAGCAIRHIQDILGHRDLRSTELYTKVDTEDLREVVDRFHPRRWTV